MNPPLASMTVALSTAPASSRRLPGRWRFNRRNPISPAQVTSRTKILTKVGIEAGSRPNTTKHACSPNANSGSQAWRKRNEAKLRSLPPVSRPAASPSPNSAIRIIWPRGKAENRRRRTGPGRAAGRRSHPPLAPVRPHPGSAHRGRSPRPAPSIRSPEQDRSLRRALDLPGQGLRRTNGQDQRRDSEQEEDGLPICPTEPFHFHASVDGESPVTGSNRRLELTYLTECR
jgi:hypothetical protein